MRRRGRPRRTAPPPPPPPPPPRNQGVDDAGLRNLIQELIRENLEAASSRRGPTPEQVVRV